MQLHALFKTVCSFSMSLVADSVTREKPIACTYVCILQICAMFVACSCKLGIVVLVFALSQIDTAGVLTPDMSM